MLDKIKHWRHRAMGWTNSCDSCPQNVLRGCPLDPRELPRPQRPHDYSISEYHLEKNMPHEYCCKNCAVLSDDLLECAICLEGLAHPARGVSSCRTCGNIVCHSCTAKLSRCPYCRTFDGLTPNLALQRILHHIDIPCRTPSNMITCRHGNCKWKGKAESVIPHLKICHMITVLNGCSMTLCIKEFKRKAELSETRPRIYAFLLACFGDILNCKVTIRHGLVKVAVRQMLETTSLGASVNVSSAFKTFRGIIPLSKAKNDVRIPATEILSPLSGYKDNIDILINIISLPKI